MLLGDDAALAAHIAGEDGPRRPVLRLLVDWDGAGTWTGAGCDLSSNVESMTVERSLTGDLPGEAGLIDGFTSSTCEIELTGWVDDTDQPVTAALSPFVVGSLRHGRQLVRAEVRAEMGMTLTDGPRLARLFTGPIRELSSEESSGTVTLSGVDPSDRLRAPITLPIYGEFITHVNERGQGDPAKGWAFTVNTQWLVDHILRKNNIYASPPARPESIISATGHGGLVAERGFNGAPISRVGSGATAPRSKWTEDQHPWGMLAPGEATPASYQEFYGFTDGITPPVTFGAGQGVGMSCWLHIGNGTGGAPATENVLFQLWPTTNRAPRLFVHGYGNGDIQCGLFDQNEFRVQTPRIPTGSGPWRFVGVHFRWVSAGTLEVRVRVDGQTLTYTVTQAAVSVVPTPFYDGYRGILQCRAYMWRAWTNLQVWPGYAPPAAGPWQGETHTSQADIDRGLNELVYLPDIVNVDSWDLLKEVVGAEFGVHRFDEQRRYAFRRRTDTRPARVDIELDVATNLDDVSYSTSTDSVRNVVGLHTKRKYHTGKVETVVKAEDALQFTVPARKRYIYDVDWPFGAAGWQGGVLPYHYQKDAETAARDRTNGFAEWSDSVAHGWTYSTRGSSGRWTILDNVQSVVVRYVQVDIRRAIVIVDNTAGSRDIRIATAESADSTQAGSPALHIGGWPLIDVPDHVEEVRAPQERINAHLGERVLSIEATDWRQEPAALRPLAAQLLDALAEEVPVLEDLPILGDPRVQAGDVAKLRFPHAADPVYGTVVKTNHGAGPNALSTTVSVRPLPEALTPVDPGDDGGGGDPGTPEAANPAPAGWLFYIDVSRFQGDRADPIDLPRVAALGYAGNVIKIGQGAGQTPGGTNYGQTLDSWWPTFRDQSLVLWPETTAGYWYVGNVETPASQAQRCAAALGDPTIPVMLDWEDGSGNWSNLLAVLDAFRSAGLKPTMLYTRATYAAEQGASNIDATGLALVNSRYWLSAATNPAQDPRAVHDEIRATRPTFGFDSFAGGTVDAHQFSDAGVVYRDAQGRAMAIDINAFPGTRSGLAAMFHAR